MKTLTLFLTIGFLSLCTSSYSQVTKNEHENPKPAITKGYYSIGNNAQKVNASRIDRTRKNTIKSIPQIQKGFYSIANNDKQLQKNKTVVAEKTSKPNIKKGYYSIGSNSEKLK